MKYACLIYEDQTLWQKMPKPEFAKGMAEYGQFTNDIKQSGNYVAGDALQPTTTATTVRVRGGAVATTNGPFAETSEQLGGYYLIEAKDMKDAIQIAARIPSAKLGAIEVRPIMVFNQP
jgi:hypothetical protein